MIIDSKHNKITSSGDLSPIDMGISDNPEDQKHILNALSSSLYTDKIAANLREYSANGADANVEAGHPEQPIEVTLPNRLQQTLCIRDFGFGMTEGQIKKTFIQLGASTKRDTRDQTGAFGIGSKAGFAYGDSFMVTSYTGGRKFIYNCYRDNGMPKLALMASEPSDAPDGIEIKVPVRSADIGEFVEKAERVFRYFKVRPIIHGAQITFERGEQVYAGTGWRLVGGDRRQSVVVSGNMGYEIDADAMGTLTEKDRAILELGIELDIELTADKIALNREGLQYTDETRKLIVAKLKVVAKEMAKIFHTQVAAATSLWAAHKLFHDLFEKLGGHNQRALRAVVEGAITWKGIKIEGSNFYIGNEENDNGIISITGVSRKSWGRGKGPRVRVNAKLEAIRATDYAQLVLNDLPTKRFSISRARGFFNDPANASFQEIAVLTYADDKAQARHHKARHLDGAPFIYLSTITPYQTPSQASGRGSYKNGKHSSKAFTLDENASEFGSSRYNKSPRSTWWESAEADLKHGAGVYVEIEKFLIKTPDGSAVDIEPHEFLAQVKRLRAAGLIDGPVYGFKHAYIDRLRLNPKSKWVRLDKAVQTALAELCECKAFLQAAADHVEAYGFDMAVPHRGNFPKGSLIQKFLDTHKKMAEGLTDSKRSLLRYINSGEASQWLNRLTLPKASVDLDDLQEQVLKRYPMFRFGTWSHARELQIAAAVEYVAMVELVEP